jgi:hypothetical protein
LARDEIGNMLLDRVFSVGIFVAHAVAAYLAE